MVSVSLRSATARRAEAPIPYTKPQPESQTDSPVRGSESLPCQSVHEHTF